MFTFHHLQVTVPDVYGVEKFYDELFNLLGFDVSKKFKGYLPHAEMDVIEYLSPTFDFGICSPKKAFAKETVDSRKPGALQHLAFKADSREAIDQIFQDIKQLDVKILHDEPREYKEKIAPNYYALFFETPDKLRFEIFHYPD